MLEQEPSKIDVLILGAGPAGLQAGFEAGKRLGGAGTVLAVDKSNRSGGILTQCIHGGFGLSRFGCELTGPEYAELLTEEAVDAGCSILLSAFVS